MLVYLDREIPISNICELVVQLMDDAEVELAIRQASHPDKLVSVTTKNEKSDFPILPPPR